MVLDFLKRANFDAFFRPSTLKSEIFSHKKIKVGYVYIMESFDTIFNIGYGAPMDYGSGKSPMDERVNLDRYKLHFSNDILELPSVCKQKP